MGRNRRFGEIHENVLIKSAGAEGVCIAYIDGQVVFVQQAAPGDLVDLKITGKKKKFLYAEITKIHEASPQRTTPFCEHYGLCGGCKWQHLSYEAQLQYKTQQVKDAFIRIGKLEFPTIPEILGSEKTTHYRNKLEYTFSNNRWLEKSLIDSEDFITRNGLGFHIPKRFDKIIHINKCWLQDDLSNDIRNFTYEFCEKAGVPFFDLKNKEGLVRNIMLRNNRKGEWMVLMVFYKEDEFNKKYLRALADQFPQITCLVYSINPKVNDSIYDLDIQLFAGEPFLHEELSGLKFRIRPKSFFQTNPAQAEVLYETALKMASLNGSECVYDLYCGTGTISLLAARKAAKVVGIEAVQQAVDDANENAVNNGVSNVEFAVGDMKDIFNEDFIQQHGKADVIITDPPRAGMHPDVVDQINRSGVPVVIYVSCNPATQARDLDMMREFYSVSAVQPVDMFPHTHHVENVARLDRKAGV
ncbi:MAG: 23S rRNA (uracil(1939)-C(5))-methyltransferase RlmD [Bacteroidetes bacterium]|nr:23S rRNA (uracil(1939)-C(5))-methyltransferase RlmD [Bacteroidota bacterium]